jgi:hypothetical protein
LPASRSCGITSIIISISIGICISGVTGDAIPFEVRQLGESFNTVLAHSTPLLPITRENCMIVRERLDFLKSWIDDRLADLESGKTSGSCPLCRAIHRRAPDALSAGLARSGIKSAHSAVASTKGAGEVNSAECAKIRKVGAGFGKRLVRRGGDEVSQGKSPAMTI